MQRGVYAWQYRALRHEIFPYFYSKSARPVGASRGSTQVRFARTHHRPHGDGAETVRAFGSALDTGRKRPYAIGGSADVEET
jgi:hypothetical protein